MNSSSFSISPPFNAANTRTHYSVEETALAFSLNSDNLQLMQRIVAINDALAAYKLAEDRLNKKLSEVYEKLKVLASYIGSSTNSLNILLLFKSLLFSSPALKIQPDLRAAIQDLQKGMGKLRPILFKEDEMIVAELKNLEIWMDDNRDLQCLQSIFSNITQQLQTLRRLLPENVKKIIDDPDLLLGVNSIIAGKMAFDSDESVARELISTNQMLIETCWPNAIINRKTEIAV